MTHTLAEGEPLIAAVRIEANRANRPATAQLGALVQAHEELIDAGVLGQVTFIRTYWYQNHTTAGRARKSSTSSKLDWKRFLGSVRPAVRCGSVRQLALVLGFRRRRDDRPVRPLGGRGALDHGRRHAYTRHGDRR